MQQAKGASKQGRDRRRKAGGKRKQRMKTILQEDVIPEQKFCFFRGF
jgi:hypothetical protein